MTQSFFIFLRPIELSQPSKELGTREQLGLRFGREVGAFPLPLECAGPSLFPMPPSGQKGSVQVSRILTLLGMWDTGFGPNFCTSAGWLCANCRAQRRNRQHKLVIRNNDEGHD